MGYKMKQNNIIRLAFIMQDQAPSTLERYICKVVQHVLTDSHQQSLGACELAKEIAERFGLEFSPTEIDKAIASKGNKDFIRADGKYSLSVRLINQNANQDSLENRLDKCISTFCISNPSYEEDEVKRLIIQHIYNCFNSSVDNLLSLLSYKNSREYEKSDYNENQIDLIDSFITWDNEEKNKTLYDIVSFSYGYCMLTVKKDIMLSKKIFTGKKFFLDSNIIFRLAGINSDERRFVITSFVDKCKEVGIALCYTDETYTEINRVINNKVTHIRNITRGQKPVSPKCIEKLSCNEDSFYNLYYEWCSQKGNSYTDYSAFKNYLYSLVNRELETLQYENTDVDKTERVSEQIDSLTRYKQSFQRQYPVSKESARCDVVNVNYVNRVRKSQGGSLFQTNSFFVSADQRLISWTSNEFSGVPIVVLPSVWLSIILRFSGRSGNDDYRAFCMFLSLRQHSDKHNELDVDKLLTNLSKKTVEQSIKEQIINQISDNRTSYRFDTEADYDSSIQRAFDKVLEDQSVEFKNQLNEVASESLKKYQDDLEKVKSDAKRNENIQISLLSKNMAAKKVKFFRDNEWLKWLVIVIVIVGVIIFGLSYWLDIPGLHKLMTEWKQTYGDKLWTPIAWLLGIVVTLMSTFAGIFDYLGSEKREKTLEKKYLSTFNSNLE